VIVAIVIAAAVILGGIIVVAMGKGGEMSVERPELPDRGDFQSASGVANYRPPGALVGYSAVATEHALALIARTIAERDAEIDWLRRRLAELQPESVADVPGDDQVGTSAGGSAGGSVGSSDGSSAGGDLPAAEVRWQASSASSGVANGSGMASGLAASQWAGGLGGEDE
jgi:hypothetical protein